MIKIINVFFLSILRVSKKRYLLSLMVALSLVACTELVVRYGLIGLVPELYIVRNKHDSYAHSAHAASRALYLSPDITPVYIFGGSGMREAVTTESELSQSINEVVDKGKFQGYVLANIYRSLAQDLALLDLISKRSGIIICGVNFTRFSFGEREYSMQLEGKTVFGRNKYFLDYMDDHYPGYIKTNPITAFLTSQTYLVSATRLFAGNAKRLFRTTKYEQHKRHQRKTLEEGYRGEKQLVRWKKTRLKGYIPSNFDMNMALLEYFIRLAQSQGHKVLVVEQPMDHDYLAGRLDETFEYYRPRLKNMVIESGAYYADFEKDLGFGTEWFADLQHIWNPEARRIYTNRLALEVKRIQTL